MPQQTQIQPIIGKVIPQPIVAEMSQSYLDYAMSVIISRALPDVRDGLKPVHRRILYAMWKMGLKPGAKFRKSATVVGETLGKYHPHGDSAVYDSLVRMAQTFSLRYPLIWGQGNFGSIDGDSAAAMRYTESKLNPIAEELLLDLEKDTVGFKDNYDGSHKEPEVLPAKIPNLLLNGTLGIAVGMATNIPPHNLSELIDGLIYLIDNPAASLEKLMAKIPGPDFPTGGLIFNTQDIQKAYATGRGGIVMRAKTEVVEAKQGDWQIVVTEIPFQINKTNLLEKIASLVKDKKIEGIKGLRDESDKDGLRIVIELKSAANPQKILNQLFKHTQLQETFHVNLVCLIDGLQPRVLSLKMALEEFIKHRQIIITRRAKFELAKAKARAHILDGLQIALANIDAIISAIKKSKDKEDAKINLSRQFKLSEAQALAILAMQLASLANLERLSIEKELKEKKSLIKELSVLLSSPQKILTTIKDELLAIKNKYQDARRTQIIPGAIDKFSPEDLIPNETAIVMITKDGYIKRLEPSSFKAQGRGGKGVIGLTTKEEDIVELFFAANTHSDVLLFTTRGKVFQLKAYDIPLASKTSRGQALVNFLEIESNEKVSTVFPLDDLKNYSHLVMVTGHGTIKKVDISAFANVRRSGLIAIKLKGSDELRWVKPSSGNDEVSLITAQGKSIRFTEKNLRPMGRNTAGVRGIRLRPGDEIVGMDVLTSAKDKNSKLLVISANGFGKMTKLTEYRLQGRGGSGIKTAGVTAKTGRLVSARVVNLEQLAADGIKGDLIISSEKGQVIRTTLKTIPTSGRPAQGVRVMRFKQPGDKVASVTLV